MKKWLCLLLVAVLLCMCGCNQQGTKNTNPNIVYEEEKSESQAKPIGTWQATIDLADAVNEHLCGIEDVDLYFLMDEFPIDVEITLTKKGKYSISVDKTMVDEKIDQLIVAAEEALMMQLEEQLMMYEMDMYTEDLDAPIPDVSMEDMLAAQGTTLEQIVTDFMAAVGAEEMRQHIMAQTTREGTYLAENDCLYLSTGEKNEIDRNIFDVYELKDGVLTFYEQYGGEDEMAVLYIYPLEFTKVK